MRLIVNGQPCDLQDGVTVSGLLAALDLDGRRLGVEVNLAIVPKSAYAATPLGEGDRIEIVHFVGGG